MQGEIRPTGKNSYDLLPVRTMDLFSHIPCLSDDQETKDFDRKAGNHWIYPENLPFRKYQYDITETALFHNTLVCLPTGLGRTFIAAVVMYNYFRWYPKGIIVFLATQPLLAQQIDACHHIMGIPMSHMIELREQAENGEISGWHESRVIFTTPYVFQHDLEHSIVPTDLIKCIVVDEAHKAIGENLYAQSIQIMHDANPHFRVLALSAIPCDLKTTPDVIRSLHITKLEIRNDKSPDVITFTHKQERKIINFNLGECLSQFKERYERIMASRVRILQENDFQGVSLNEISKGMINRVGKELKGRPNKPIVVKTLRILLTMYDAFVSMTSRGLRVFLQNYENPSSQWCLDNEPDVRQLLQDIKEYLDQFPAVEALMELIVTDEPRDIVFGFGKIDVLKRILIKYFEEAGNDKDIRRVIVFADSKDIANEIHVSLLQCPPPIRPLVLMGRSDFTEQQQIEALHNFGINRANVMISTSSEGYDISEADLLVCFDKLQCSPRSLDQLIGRTGKSRDGRVIFFVANNEERQNLEELLAQRDSLKYGGSYAKGRFDSDLQLGPRMIPEDIQPEALKIHMNVEAKSPERKRKRSEIHPTAMVFNNETACGESPPAKEANEQTASSLPSAISGIQETVRKSEDKLDDSGLRKRNPNLFERGTKRGESTLTADPNDLNDCQSSFRQINQKLLSKISTDSKDDTLKTCCENVPQPHSNNIPGASQLEPIDMKPRLQDHFLKLFQNPKNSDIVVIVEDQRFHVHKLILETRSPVFASIFEREMKESSTYEMVIGNMKPEVVRKMLEFIYIDKIEDYEEMADELMIAAHRFALGRLAGLCEQLLYSKLKISNAVETFIVADSCMSKSLKNQVAKLMHEHLPEIINTPGYKKLEKSRPELACYLIRFAVSQEAEN